jgi:hypothetical protein
MKIIVRKMPQMVLDKSFEQIEGLYETCYAGNATQTYLKSCAMAEGKASLNMEDDVQLTSNFLEKIKAEIQKNPEKVITFFTLKSSITETTEMPGRTFCMAQCVYQPGWFNKAMLEYHPLWEQTERGKQQGHALDYMMADYLADHKMTYILYQPSLVQHLEMKSRIDPRRSSKRQSKTFKI